MRGHVGVPRASSQPRTSCADPQGEHLLHVLNTLESRAVVLEAELQEINEDIETNSILARKYGDSFFKEGSTRLSQAQVGGHPSFRTLVC